MDDQIRARRSPPEVQREFIGCRLESQVLIRAYLLVVPVIRRSTATPRKSSVEGDAGACKPRSQCIAQGA
jgi:hypothetical protein